MSESGGPHHGDHDQRPPRGLFPTEDEIAARAYELYVSNGRRIDRVLEFWSKAERELLTRAAQRI